MKAPAVLLLAFALSCSRPQRSAAIRAPAQLPPDSSLDAPCVSMDHTKDKDALDCLRAAEPTFLQHKDIKETAGNLVGCTGANGTAGYAVTIAGHGVAGSINTGGGKSFKDNTKFIDSSNTSEKMFWGTYFDDLSATTGRTGLISLFACDTGAGIPGAKLVHRMAKRVGRPVRARTGLAKCKGNVISFEEGSVWQMAKPTDINPPAAIGPPSHPKREARSRISFGGLSFDAGDVISIEVLREIGPEKDRRWKTIEQKSVRPVIDLIEFDRPQDFGTIFAGETGRMKIFITGKLKPIELAILADRVLHDANEPGPFYFDNDEFIPTLAHLLNWEDALN